MRKEKELEIVEQTEPLDIEAIQEMATASQELIPQMNVTLPTVAASPEEQKLISDEKLIGVYDEALDNIRKDRHEIDELLASFKDMVLNDGDATSASKEAVVNLIKIKTDTADKMTKIADLMLRTRGVSTFKPYFNAKQSNTINIGEVPKRNLTAEEKRTLIETEARRVKKEEVT